MDSLLHLGLDQEDDDDDDDDEQEDEQGQDEPKGAEPPPPAVAALDYEALQRAGLRETSDLRETDTYKRLEAESAAKQEVERAAAAEEAAAEAARAAELEQARSELLDRKKIDEKVGYQKRFDKTGETFREKEKRKRSTGQQASAGDWVQEEKRRLRHGSTNYDS